MRDWMIPAVLIVGSWAGLALQPVSAGDTPCMYNPDTREYASCAATSMGGCNHYMSSCEPADGCWFDPSDGVHKRCASASMGECNHYTSTCEADCMWNPAGKRYERCAASSMGTCSHYMSSCTPS